MSKVSKFQFQDGNSQLSPITLENMKSTAGMFYFVVLLWMLRFVSGGAPLSSGLPQKFVADSLDYFLPLRPLMIVEETEDIYFHSEKQLTAYHTYEPGECF